VNFCCRLPGDFDKRDWPYPLLVGSIRCGWDSTQHAPCCSTNGRNGRGVRIHQASSEEEELPGVAGFAADIIEALGEWGVGLLTLIETVFPPIPSEVVLPLAGYLSQTGDSNLALLFVTCTLCAYLGALMLYWMGAAVGLERSIRGLSRLPW